MSSYKKHFNEVLKLKLKETGNYNNIMEVPKFEKIVINIGLGKALADKKILDHAMSDLTKIAGQKPVLTYARKSISNFKLRKGYPIGIKVTLRNERMYNFLEKLIAIVIPRIRDFRGLSAHAFDGKGNYTFGIKEQIVFPEIDYDKVDALRGMDITLVTTAKTNKEAYALLKVFNFPFKEANF